MSTQPIQRRQFLRGAALALGSAAVSRVGAASLPEAPIQHSPLTQPPLVPANGRPYQPVVTLNGWSLPWRMKEGIKEFHLVAEPIEREIAPGMTAQLWGYNGQSPGPTIEVVEGDRVRIFVTNRLSQATSVHWHGQRLPNGMDGVAGLTQPPIPPGKTWVYEFTARRAGTFMYHPHADEMVQMAMGMMGLWITHPKNPGLMRVDRDFAFLINAYDIDPGTATPKVNTMTDFNLWTWNSRAFPGIDPLVVRQHDRVRIRMGNLTMTNHPIHLHGHDFTVTGTDGGWVPPAARWPEVTTDIAVGQMRAIEFDASEAGDWALHCHKTHHTMNAMSHDAPARPEAAPDAMAHHMHMGMETAMKLPPNTLPMTGGPGPYGSIGMGGMFSVVKVRRQLARNDYRDPGWYQAPPGSIAHEWQGEPPPAAPQAADQAPTMDMPQHGHHHGGD